MVGRARNGARAPVPKRGAVGELESAQKDSFAHAKAKQLIRRPRHMVGDPCQARFGVQSLRSRDYLCERQSALCSAICLMCVPPHIICPPKAEGFIPVNSASRKGKRLSQDQAFKIFGRARAARYSALWHTSSRRCFPSVQTSGHSGHISDPFI